MEAHKKRAREDLDARTLNIAEAIRISISDAGDDGASTTEVGPSGNAIDGPCFSFTWKMANGNEYHVEVTGPPYPINWGEPCTT